MRLRCACLRGGESLMVLAPDSAVEKTEGEINQIAIELRVCVAVDVAASALLVT